MTVTENQILQELSKVLDPEIGVPITELKLVDEVKIRNSTIKVKFHLTSPFCPPAFALMIGKEIKERISKIEGVSQVYVEVTSHIMAELLNKELKNF